MTKSKIQLGVKFLLLVGMVFFIFPFVTVSCSTVTYDFTGMELMTTITLKEDLESASQQLYPNFLLMGAFVLAGFATFFGWKSIADQEEGSRGAVICSILGTICLILFPFTFQVYYNLDALITVEFQWGFYASLLAYLGGTVCILADFQGVGSNPVDFSDGTRNGQPPGTDQHTAIPAALPQPVSPPVKVSLQIVQSGASQIVPLMTLPCYLGSDKKLCQIVLPDPGISPVHAQIYMENGSVFLQDLGTENGTILNGARVTTPEEVLSGDEAALGSFRIRFIVGT